MQDRFAAWSRIASRYELGHRPNEHAARDPGVIEGTTGGVRVEIEVERHNTEPEARMLTRFRTALQGLPTAMTRRLPGERIPDYYATTTVRAEHPVGCGPDFNAYAGGRVARLWRRRRGPEQGAVVGEYVVRTFDPEIVDLFESEGVRGPLQALPRDMWILSDRNHLTVRQLGAATDEVRLAAAVELALAMAAGGRSSLTALGERLGGAARFDGSWRLVRDGPPAVSFALQPYVEAARIVAAASCGADLPAGRVAIGEDGALEPNDLAGNERLPRDLLPRLAPALLVVGAGHASVVWAPWRFTVDRGLAALDVLESLAG